MNNDFSKAFDNLRTCVDGVACWSGISSWCEKQRNCTECKSNVSSHMEALYDAHNHDTTEYRDAGVKLTMLQRALSKDYGINAKWDGLRHAWSIETDTTQRQDELRAAWHEGYTAALHRRETETWQLDQERMEAVRRLREYDGENDRIERFYDVLGVKTGQSATDRLIHLLGGDSNSPNTVSEDAEFAEHSDDREKVVRKLQALQFDGGSHENLAKIAYAIYPCATGWTCESCEGLRDLLVRLIGGDDADVHMEGRNRSLHQCDNIARWDGSEQRAADDHCHSSDGHMGHSVGVGGDDGGRGVSDDVCSDTDGDAPADSVGEQAETITDELRKRAKKVWSCDWDEFNAIADRIDVEYDRWKHLADVNARAFIRVNTECKRLRLERDTAEIVRDKLKHNAERDADLIESMVGNLNDMESERDRLKADIQQNRYHIHLLRTKVKGLEAERDQLQAECDRLTTALDELHADPVNDAICRLERERDELKEHCRNQQKQLAEFNRVMNTWHWDLENHKQWCPMALDKAVRKATERWESACGRIGELKDERDDLKMRLREFADNQACEREHYQKRIKKLVEERDAARRGLTIEVYRDAYDELVEQRNNLVRDVAHLRAERDYYKADNEELQRNLNRASFKRVEAEAERDRYKAACEAAQSPNRDMMDGLEGYVELPKDVYGECVRPGDTLTDGEYTFVVEEIAYCGGKRWSIRNDRGAAWALCDVYHASEEEE